MLVARVQLRFVERLVSFLSLADGEMRPVDEVKGQLIAVIALLRSIGHVLEKVDADTDAKRAWLAGDWPSWKTEPIFKDFIEPTRNMLLKEFDGISRLIDRAFSAHAAVAAPTPEMVMMMGAFDPALLRDDASSDIWPKIGAALDYWDRRVRETENVFAGLET